MLEHRCMRQRSPYIVAHQASIEEAILRRLETLDLFMQTIALLP
jgi:hypothetical protein